MSQIPYHREGDSPDCRGRGCYPSYLLNWPWRKNFHVPLLLLIQIILLILYALFVKFNDDPWTEVGQLVRSSMNL